MITVLVVGAVLATTLQLWPRPGLQTPRPGSAPADESAAPAASAPSDDPTASATPTLPERLPPFLDGEPRGAGPDYCDPVHWRSLEGFVRALEGDRASIDGRAWARLGASARTGVAAWISRCRNDGRAVGLVDDESGGALGHYSPEAGWIPAEPR